MREAELDQLRPNQRDERRALIPPHLDRLHLGVVRARSWRRLAPREPAQGSSDAASHHCERALEGERHFVCARAVLIEKVVDDVVTLVHRDPRTRIFHVRHCHLPALRLELCSEAVACARAGAVLDGEREDRARLPNLAAEGRAVVLVDDERRRRAVEVGHLRGVGQEDRPELQRVLPVGHVVERVAGLPPEGEDPRGEPEPDAHRCLEHVGDDGVVGQGERLGLRQNEPLGRLHLLQLHDYASEPLRRAG
mmetsp:Transcript_59365/g.141121  ORF Transcript_59365/g.141121 Transcript_59365/m.141121 type:complete len:251 (-) Transcript_59365:119-871(-)